LEVDAGGTSPDVVWQPGLIGRAERWESTGQQGATIWFTGLSGSGKSTIASACESLLVASGRAAYMLDGDNIRHGLSGDLGFSDEDRGENMRRVAEVARLFADSGTVALVALISPYRAGRRSARAIHEDVGLKFVEVFVDTPLEVCEERDVKGFYALARAGEMPGFTGVDGPFERPEEPDLVLSTDDGPALAAATRVLDLLG